MVLFHHFLPVFHPALFLSRHFRPDKNNVPAIPVNSSPPDHHPNQITTQRSGIIERFNNVRSSPSENPPFRAGAKIFTFHRPSLIFQPLLNPQVKIHPLWSGQRFSSTHHPSPIFTPSLNPSVFRVGQKFSLFPTRQIETKNFTPTLTRSKPATSHLATRHLNTTLQTQNDQV